MASRPQSIPQLLLTLVMWLAVATDPAWTKSPPNILFVYVDDLGFRDVGFNGAIYYKTPNIDRLASQGMVFTNAYSNGPNCAPSRACLMSGQYSPRHGIFSVGKSARGSSAERKLIPADNRTELPLELTTLGELFRNAGYRTGYVGKWHLGKPGQSGPQEQGFDFNAGGNHTGSPAGGYFPPYKNPQLPDPPSGSRQRREYLTERLTRESVDFIGTDRTQPFFLFVSHYAVHTPIQARAEIIDRYHDLAQAQEFNKKYAAMIQSVDESVGHIMDELESLDLLDQTLVVFCSDNGGHGKITDNAPLRGSKGMLYEGGIRVPMCVRWPGRIAAGSKADVPVTGVDFFETFRVLLKAEPPAEQTLDGVDLMPLLTGESNTLQRSSLFWHFPAYLQGANYPGANDAIFRTRPCAAIRNGSWKLIEFYEDDRIELYNLATDPGESTNLAAEHPETAQRLQKSLRKWQQQTGAPVPNELNPQFQPAGN